mgnify:CR=1 FL=1
MDADQLIPIQVEVCIQNEWDDTDGEQGTQLSAIAPLSEVNYQIAPETWETWFQTWLKTLQPDFSPIHAYELSLRLTGDREIQTLNAQYRNQDKPTDVLAFSALEKDAPQNEEMQNTLPLYLGDIIISLDTAQKQADAQGHSLETELAWLGSHGLLHLLGWDHPDEERLIEMLSQQKALLHTVGL